MRIIILLFLLSVSPAVIASELMLEFKTGWGTDYTLHFDFNKGEITYKPDKKDKSEKPTEPRRQKLINSKNVGL